MNQQNEKAPEQGASEQLEELIRRIVQEEIAKAMRPGGVLHR